MASADPKRRELPPLIAVVGCDGSGKSTLSGDLIRWLSKDRPTETAYLGLRSGDLGNRIKQWPLIGKRFEAYLSKKAGQAKKKDATIPGLPTALVIYIFSLIRMRRFRAMMAKRRSGILVITDRYPQTEVPGFYDGPGLSAAAPKGRIVAWLARKEMDMYRQMADIVPDLVIRLNIDVETAYARKPDHKLASLQAKVAVTPQLKFNGAHIVDLSSLDPYDQVLEQAKREIGRLIANGR